MANVMAIIKKTVFEADAPHAKPGDLLGIDRYVSSNPALSPAGEGEGALYLVTVRPPDERLWLVAILRGPRFGGGKWSATNATPVTDVSSLRPRLRFTSDTGMSQKAGALGMSLQTPRVLTAADTALLETAVAPAAGRRPPAPAGAAAPPAKKKPAAAKAAPVAPKHAARSPTRKPAAPARVTSSGGDLPSLLALWRRSRDGATAAAIEALEPGDFGAELGAAESTTEYGLRVQRFASAAADPRIAAAFCALVEKPRYTAHSGKASWIQILDALADQHADPRTAARLSPLVARYQGIFGATNMGHWMQGRLRALVDGLVARFPDALASAAAPAPARRGPPASEEEFLRDVAADPDDDAPRLVFADWLLERGDPRGDFITLQYQRHRGALTPADEERERALIEAHADAWVGPLAEATTNRRFERGFLHACRLRGKKFVATIGDPAWSTVRELTLRTDGEGRDRAAAELLLDPTLRRLRALRELPTAALETLARAIPNAFPDAEELTGAAYQPHTLDKLPAWWPTFLDGAALPRLRRLRLWPYLREPIDAFNALWSSSLARRVEHIRLDHVHGWHGGRWHRALLDLGRDITATVELGPWEARPAAGGRHTALTLHLDFAILHLGDRLAEFAPDAITSLTIVPGDTAISQPDVGRLEKAARQRFPRIQLDIRSGPAVPPPNEDDE